MKDQTAYGVCDIITHVSEGYFTGVDGTPRQDRFAESVIINAIEWGRKAVADGSDLEARAQVQWASIVALNGWVQVVYDEEGKKLPDEHMQLID